MIKDIVRLKDFAIIDQAFREALPKEMLQELNQYREGDVKKGKELSNFLIELAICLEQFLYSYFSLNKKGNKQNIEAYLLVEIKKTFIQRRVSSKYNTPAKIEELFGQLSQIDGENNLSYLLTKEINQEFEINFCKQVQLALNNKDEYEIINLEKQAAYILYHPKLDIVRNNSILFNLPKKYTGEYLFDFIRNDGDVIEAKHKKFRYGFNLTDEGAGDAYAVDQTNYCIFCHNQQKDSCSHGLKDANGSFKESPINGAANIGCPLEEKISEMNYLKFKNFNLAAFAIALMDNPMLAATGHRICNDCMKACIYQKQEPVNIPQIESNILQSILDMDYGFELYYLLIMWNPLLAKNYLPSCPKGRKIMVVGLGPAGFTLTHYLARIGYEVIAIDGLKINPMNNRFLEPIKNIYDLFTNLSNYQSDGFGGVMEYGITHRWNKNYLKLIRALLERRSNISILGGVRLGSNLTIEQVKELGIQHIALCTGAGKPNIPGVKNILIDGVKTASDFLMNLQSGSAFKFSSLVNLQIRMPIVVIGGGLTAVDTATEAAAYYLIQIEKFYQSYQKLGKNLEKLALNEQEKIIADEFITHALMAREELKKDQPNIAQLIDSFGGVKILYRKSIKDSPAYKNNHEELEKALEEGIRFFEYQELQKVIEDDFGHLKSVLTLYKNQGLMEIGAKTMLLAIGTSPNITLAEEEELLKIDGLFLRSLNINGQQIKPERIAKPKENLFFTHLEKDFSVSFFGDSHPSYAGNVVKAIASAKNGYDHIDRLVSSYSNMISQITNSSIAKLLKAEVREINILSDNIVELIVHAPLSARNFKPGQFFKLQNYPSEHLDCFEPLALTGAKIWPDLGLLSLIILEMGGSSSLCRKLKIGESVSLMGPTGEATKIKEKENILLVGGGLGNAVLFSIGQKAKELNCHVTYFAGYRKAKDLFKQEEIEKASDEIIWCFDENNSLQTRQQDKLFIGNLIEALTFYGKDKLSNFDRIITIGSNGLMEAVSNFIKDNKYCLKEKVETIASINSPMQCMMKEICAQCLQKHKDPISGVETYVYSCKSQDQDINFVDFKHLSSRLKQNSLQEKIYNINKH